MIFLSYLGVIVVTTLLIWEIYKKISERRIAQRMKKQVLSIYPEPTKAERDPGTLDEVPELPNKDWWSSGKKKRIGGRWYQTDEEIQESNIEPPPAPDT